MITNPTVLIYFAESRASEQGTAACRRRPARLAGAAGHGAESRPGSGLSMLLSRLIHGDVATAQAG